MGRIISALSYDIFTTQAGDPQNETILFIHGFPTSSWDWSYIWDDLKRDYHLVALDLLGFGFSDKPKGHNYSIIEQADTVEAVIAQFGLKAYHVLAHDYGDTVAQELLARQNEGVGQGQWTSGCFLNGGLFPEQHRPRLIQKLLLTPIGPLINHMMGKGQFATSFSAVFGPETKPSAVEIDAFWEMISHNNGKQAFSRLIRYIPERVQYRDRWRGALRQAAMPLALINGSVDPVSGAHMVDYYLEHIGEPDYLARLDIIGHYPQTEAPDSVIKHYRKFLSVA